MARPTDVPTRVPATPAGVVDLRSAGDELLERARARTGGGRAARTLTPGQGAPLKQTLLAIRGGQQLADHRAPGAATLAVLRGRVSLVWPGHLVDLPEGQWAPIPDAVHSLRADEDAVVLLSVARDVAASAPGDAPR